MKLPGIQSITDVNVRRALENIQAAFTSLEENYGIQLAGSKTTTSDDSTAPPPLASFDSVAGKDGKFVISIINPDGVDGPIYHEILTASTLPLSAATDIQRYGPDVAVSIEITDPNVKKYVAVRSKFINSRFNKMLAWPDVIDSGVISSGSLSQINTSMIPVIAAILSQEGTTTVIDAAASVWNEGNDSDGNPIIVSYPPGSVDAGGYGIFYVFGLDPDKSGALLNGYQVTPNLSDLTVDDATVSFGAINIQPAGGATGTTAGSGPAVVSTPPQDI